MKKRQTDIHKWTANKWFRTLSLKDKLFWLYVNDMCDYVGVWEVDIEQASFHIRTDYEIELLKETFMDHIYVFNNGRSWWLIDFVRFQYKELREYSSEEIEKNPKLKNSPLPTYVERLKYYGLPYFRCKLCFEVSIK